MGTDNENGDNGEYTSYDDYLNSANNLADAGLADQTQGDAAGSVADTGADSIPGSESYGSYDDYMKGQSSYDGNTFSDSYNDTVEGDQSAADTGDEIDIANGSSDDASGGALSSSADGKTLGGDSSDATQGNSLLGEGGESDAGAAAMSGGESAAESAGGLVSSVKEGIGNAARGIANGLKSGVGGLVSKGKGGIQSVANKLNVSFKAAAIATGVSAGGATVGILSLIFGGQAVKQYTSDYSNCNNMTMIDEYVATMGESDHWTEDSAKGAAKEIYTALSSCEDVEFWTWQWTGSKWEEIKAKKQGFGFSDEAIAGMLSNAYAESKIRATCYEMDYLVHDIDERDEDGNYKYVITSNLNHEDNEADFILGRTHHTNWDAYVDRMFEIYDAGGDNGSKLDIDEDAYEWTSDDANDLFVGKYGGVGSIVISGNYGKMPGIGLWQWTGQRAFNMSYFADTQHEPEDNDNDGTADVLYTIPLQLAFLYFEDYGDFSVDKGGKVKDAEKTVEYMWKNPATKEEEPKTVTFEATGTGVLAWGRQNRYDYTGKVTSTGMNEVEEEDGSLAFKRLSYGAHDDKKEYTYKGTKQDIEMEGKDLYAGQKKSKIEKEDDVWDPEEDETTIRHPKFILKNLDNGDEIGQRPSSDEYSPSDYLAKESVTAWESGGLKRYIVEEGRGSDNRVAHKYTATKAEYDSNYQVPCEIKLATQWEKGEPDSGYWAISSHSDLLDGEYTNYRNNLQSLEDGEGGDYPETRRKTEVRTGREFNKTEVAKIKSNYKYYTKYTKEEQADGTVRYYKYVTLDIKNLDKMDKTRKQMEDAKGKYIVADLHLTTGAESAVECARQFYLCWEGGPENTKMMRDHMKKAGNFYILMKTDGWKANDAYANSILQMADENLNNHELRDMHATYVQMGCEDELVAPQGIAECAVAWAWPGWTSDNTIDAGTNQKGQYFDINMPDKDGTGAFSKSRMTSLYAAMLDKVCPEHGGIYSSCDRAVCCAVRAAGADDNFVPGNAAGAFMYAASSSDKWRDLGPIGPGQVDTLEPGDLLITNQGSGGASGHVMVYVGDEIPKDKWPEFSGKYGVVHASHSSNPTSSRGPRCDQDVTRILSGRSFHAFRCLEYESSSKYEDIATMVFNVGYVCGDGEGGTTYEPGSEMGGAE